MRPYCAQLPHLGVPAVICWFLPLASSVCPHFTAEKTRVQGEPRKELALNPYAVGQDHDQGLGWIPPTAGSELGSMRTPHQSWFPPGS